MVPDDLVLGGGEHLVGIVVAEVLLVHEGQFPDIVQTVDVEGGYVGLPHPVVVELVEAVEVVNKLFQFVVLELLELLVWHCLDPRVPEHDQFPVLAFAMLSYYYN